MVLRFAAFFICILSLSTSFSKSKNLGERNFSHYYGPEFPLVMYSKYSHKHTFLDQRTYNIYFNSKISPELFVLKDFFEHEYLIGQSCPDDVYEKNYDYISYLYRLISLSYHFENMRAYEYTAKQFQFNNICRIDWKEEFKKCRASSADMLSFKNNAIRISKVLTPILVPFDESKSFALNNWLKNYNNKKEMNVVQYRVAAYCEKHSCGALTKKSLETILKSICTEDRQNFNLICSERDRNYGNSEIPEFYNAISRSNAMRNISSIENGPGCLKRYIIQNKGREVRNTQYSKSFSLLYEQKMLEDDLQGRLFSLGAMKEFSEKGIADIFDSQAVSEAKPKNKTLKVSQMTVPKFEIIELPKFVKKKKTQKKIVKVKPVVVKKKENISSFLSAVEFRKRFKLDHLKLDMDKFKYDYLFTVSKKKTLDPVVERFGRYKVLQEMKKNDSLGSNKAPIPLIYVKYLIENRSDQLLFNLINVIGNDFYVLNDIDKNIKQPTKIKLSNDNKTNYQWQIDILK